MNHTLDDRPAVDTLAEPTLSQSLSPMPAARPARLASTLALSATAAAALQACGGGGGSEPPPTDSTPLTREQASRVLGSGAFGGNAADIENVRTLGLDGWLAAQFAIPRSQGHVAWMRANAYEVTPNTSNIDRVGVIRSIWRKLISSPDVLRQRVTLALSEIFVISLTPVLLPYRGFASAAFMDILEANAFGSYKDLLLQVSQCPAMGAYLSFLGSKKANTSGSMPDENYAREVMQLFSIGLLKLNLDGTPIVVGGVAQPTYTQADVTQLARVFTGWRLDKRTGDAPADPEVRAMYCYDNDHEKGETNFLDQKVPAGTSGADALALTVEALMRQPSMAPFIARQLIQRLVTSNPSSGYVQRVATVFNGNGSHAKGDMKATITAILSDDEARSADGLTSPTHGKLREPMVRFIQWARTFGLTSSDGLWDIGNLSSVATGLGQSPLRSPSVFNFFRPGYVPPASELGNEGITAPEFQITTETSVAGYVNFMQRVVSRGIAGMVANYAALTPLVGDSNALLAELNVLLAAGQLSAATLAALAAALESIDTTTPAGRNNRLYAALTLVMAAPEYLVQK